MVNEPLTKYINSFKVSYYIIFSRSGQENLKVFVGGKKKREIEQLLVDATV